LQEELRIGTEEMAPELSGRLSEMGAPLMVETLRDWRRESWRAGAGSCRGYVGADVEAGGWTD